jgi:hypothetical protein
MGVGARAEGANCFTGGTSPPGSEERRDTVPAYIVRLLRSSHVRNPAFGIDLDTDTDPDPDAD